MYLFLSFSDVRSQKGWLKLSLHLKFRTYDTGQHSNFVNQVKIIKHEYVRRHPLIQKNWKQKMCHESMHRDRIGRPSISNMVGVLSCFNGLQTQAAGFG